MKRWKINYNGNEIVVENRAVRESLYVNGVLQDECIGLFAARARLFGHLETGEKIKVSIGQIWRYKCRVFLNDELILRGE